MHTVFKKLETKLLHLTYTTQSTVSAKALWTILDRTRFTTNLFISLSDRWQSAYCWHPLSQRGTCVIILVYWSIVRLTLLYRVWCFLSLVSESLGFDLTLWAAILGLKPH